MPIVQITRLQAAVAVALAAVCVSLPAQARSAKAPSKTTKNYLVPPPPAYMPSILPELYFKQQAQKEPKKENPYSKYVYTREGYEDPLPRQTNRYVTYWNGN